jgi:hypothetical protein
MTNKIDSNLTGLCYVEEVTPGVLPGSPVWKPLEPNSYSDFGAQTKNTARNPITQSRQRQKGSVTDLDASAGFSLDMTQDNLYDLLQGFMFADWRKKDVDTVTAVSTSYTLAANGTDYRANDLVFGSGFGVAANNGLHLVTASTSTSVTANGIAAEATPPATAQIHRMGAQFASGDATITVTSGVAALVTTTKDLTQLGLIPGEWVFIGGDTATMQFATATNNCFARVATIATNKITFDKTGQTMVADTGTGKTIQIFFGDVIKNESNPALIKSRSYQFERSLSTAGYEYVIGSFANEMQIKLTQGSKITVDLNFVSLDAQTQAGAKTGTHPAIATSSSAFNTSSDFSRLRLEKLDATGLTNYMTEATVTINNGITPIKALGKLGAVDVSYGDFAVSGSLTALFTDIATVQAVRNNADVTMDFALVARNAGVVIDIPLVALGNGRLQVEKDNPIKIPLTPEAAAHQTLNHTLLICNFCYLPSLADS